MSAISPDTMTTIDEIIDNFSLLEEWDDRYRYVIELGRGLSPLSDQDRTDANKVQGCASQVWLATTVRPNGQHGPALTFCGDSDAHIVRGLIAILFAMFSGKPAREILVGRRDRAVRAPRPARALDAAALERISFDGRAHSRRRPRGAGRHHVTGAHAAATCAGAAAGRAPSAWRGASVRPRSSAPPSDSPAAIPIFRGTAPASCCIACAGDA